MDFDSIISFLLILLFFIAPTLLKRFKQKKKTAAPPKPKKISLFGKLGDQLREYAQTLEQEAQKESPGNIWAHLADEQELPPKEDSFEKEFDAPNGEKPRVAAPAFAAASVTPEKMMPEKKERKTVPKPERKGGYSPGVGSFKSPKLSSCQLQQAIVWSEILSKPLALRQD